MRQNTSLMPSLMLCSLISCSLPIQAEGFQVGLGTIIGSSKLSGRDESENLFSGQFSLGYQWEHLGFEVGYETMRDYMVDSGSDTTSEYRVDLDQEQFFINAIFFAEVDGLWPYKFFAGITQAEVELKVQESFYEQQPAGSTTITDDNIGWKAGAAIFPYYSNKGAFAVGVEMKKNTDIFDESDRPFDIENLGLNMTFYRLF